MPELPELHAHAERLHAALAGRVLDAFEPLTFTALKTFSPAPDVARGRPLDDVARRGKYVLLRFGDVTFVAHLMHGGRLKPDPSGSKRPRGGVARWRFDGGDALLLTEPGTERKAGVWVVEGDARAQPPLDALGPEADTLDIERMTALLRAHSMRLHTFLRDQHIVAGIGRRLANEICHRAQLSPFAQTRQLDHDAAARIVAAIHATVDEGLEAERGRADMGAAADRRAAVHARAGEACPVCGDTIRAVEYRDYTVNYCATCQTGGKILADNTLSKFGIYDSPVKARRKPASRRRS
jgi:formamidopyrimidine-DNA glycosylase